MSKPQRKGSGPDMVRESAAVKEFGSVLLVNPAVYDSRFPWAKWQQPTSLYRLSSYLRSRGADVTFLDALITDKGSRLRKEKVGSIQLEGQRVDRWRFGRSRGELLKEIRALAKVGPRPIHIVVECATTFWWKGAREIVELADEVFPGATVEVIGAYAGLAPDHVAGVTGARPGALPAEALSMPADWPMAPRRPAIGYLSTAGGTRAADEIVEEIEAGTRRGLTLFAFVEHGLPGRHVDLFTSVLETIIERKPRRVAFVATGTISPAEFVQHPHLPELMRTAGYRQVFFADDRDVALTQVGAAEFIDQCRQAASLCHAAGFRARSDELAAGVCLGRAGEDLDERARVLTLASHALGSVIVWPYQPSLAECPGMDPEEVNGKLFPLRTRNGATYRDYLNVLGLATVLNAKYREHTFDFLGESLMARLFRDSLAREAWLPEEEIKGSLRLPAPSPRVRGAA